MNKETLDTLAKQHPELVDAVRAASSASRKADRARRKDRNEVTEQAVKDCHAIEHAAERALKDAETGQRHLEVVEKKAATTDPKPRVRKAAAKK